MVGYKGPGIRQGMFVTLDSPGLQPMGFYFFRPQYPTEGSEREREKERERERERERESNTSVIKTQHSYIYKHTFNHPK